MPYIKSAAVLCCLYVSCLSVSATSALQAEILASEEALYAAIFDRCDLPAVEKLVASDLEFFHDKAGQVAKSGSDFVAAIRGSCANQQQGREAKTRRVAIEGTFRAHRMGEYGALAVGVHRFFHVQPGT